MTMDLDGNRLTGRQLVVRGVAASVVVALVTAVLLAKWFGVFDSSTRAVAVLRNIGDGLPARSDVKFHGILVGTVDEVVAGSGTRPNEVHIRLDARFAPAIPATVTARVVPSNVFAVSALQLVDGDTPPARGVTPPARGAAPPARDAAAPPIRNGARIAEDTALPTVLFQTTLSKLRDVLAAGARSGDDDTVGVLAAVGKATSNRGGTLLESTRQLDRLIDEVRSTLAAPGQPSTLSALTDAASGLSETAPELVDALHQAVGPMRTLAEQRGQLQNFLAAGLHTARTTATALTNQTDRLVHITTDLTPVLGVLAQHAAALGGISQRITRFSDAFFAEVWDSEMDTPHGRINLSFTPTSSYTRADCPRYGALAGPSCSTAPEVVVRPDLPEVLLPQNFSPPPGLAPPPGTVVGPNGNLVAVGPPLVNPTPDLTDPNPPLAPGIAPAPPLPGTVSDSAAPASFGGNVGPVGSAPEREQLARITGREATVATQLILAPVARGTVVTRTGGSQ